MHTVVESGAYRVNEKSTLNFVFPPDGTRRGVLFAQGGGGNAYSELATAALIKQPETITRFGYPFMTADLCAAAYAGFNFGNDDHIAAVQAAFTYLTTVGRAKADKVCLMAGSMGALGVLNWARANKNKVACIILLIPPLQLNVAYQTGIYQAQIATAYGVAYPAALPGLATHDPNVYAEELAGIPIKIWASDNDTVASNTHIAKQWAARVGTAEVVSVGALGHSAGNIPPKELVRFFNANGGLV